MNYSKKTIEGYEIQEQLGQGAFAIVYKCVDICTQETYAMKIIQKEKLDLLNYSAPQLIQQEIKALKQVDSKYVIKLYKDFYYEENLFLILEYCDGSLDDIWKNKYQCQMPLDIVILYFQQIVLGLGALHQQKIIHRDLKLQNILIQKNQAKIADLGFCKQFDGSQDFSQLNLGTIGFKAPEIEQNKRYYLSADIFSLGCILYQLIFGYLPFGDSSSTYLEHIQQNNINFNLDQEEIDKDLKELIMGMLKENAKERFSFQQIYNFKKFTLLNKNDDQVEIQQSKEFYQESSNKETASNQDYVIIPSNMQSKSEELHEPNNIENRTNSILKELYLQQKAINYVYKTYQIITNYDFNNSDEIQILAFIIYKQAYIHFNCLNSKLSIHPSIIDQFQPLQELVEELTTQNICNLVNKITQNTQFKKTIPKQYQSEYEYYDFIKSIEVYNINIEKIIKKLKLIFNKETFKKKRKIAYGVYHLLNCMNYKVLEKQEIEFQIEQQQLNQLNLDTLLFRIGQLENYKINNQS